MSMRMLSSDGVFELTVIPEMGRKTVDLQIKVAKPTTSNDRIRVCKTKLNKVEVEALCSALKAAVR